MVRHETELQDTDLRIVLMPMYDALNEIFTKLRLVDIRFGGIIVRDDEFAEQRFAAGKSERDMIDTNAFPCRAAFLPMPLFLCHDLKFCAKVRLFCNIRKFLGENFRIREF